MSKRPTKVYIVYSESRDIVASKYSSNCFYLRRGDATKRAKDCNRYKSNGAYPNDYVVYEGDITWTKGEVL